MESRWAVKPDPAAIICYHGIEELRLGNEAKEILMRPMRSFEPDGAKFFWMLLDSERAGCNERRVTLHWK